MNNCLVTTLKATVNNPDLRKLGEFRFEIARLSDSFTVKTKGTCILNILSPNDATFTNSPASGERTQTLINGERTMSVNKACVISAIGKYDLEYLKDSGVQLKINLEELQYISSLKQILLRRCMYYDTIIPSSYGDIANLAECNAIEMMTIMSPDVYGNILTLPSSESCTIVAFSHATTEGEHANVEGDISSFADKYPNLATLRIARSTGVFGDIADLHELHSLTSLDLTGTNVGGTIEDFLDGMYDSGGGRTTGTLVIKVQNTQVTYNGSSVTSDLTATFAAGGWTIS